MSAYKLELFLYGRFLCELMAAPNATIDSVFECMLAHIKTDEQTLAIIGDNKVSTSWRNETIEETVKKAITIQNRLYVSTGSLVWAIEHVQS